MIVNLCKLVFDWKIVRKVILFFIFKSISFSVACHYETIPTLEGFVGAIDSATPCAMMLNLAVTLKDILNDQMIFNPELTLTFVFFDGEEAMQSWSSIDSVYGSTHLSTIWKAEQFNLPVESQFCQDGNATYLDRMDVLFLLDLIGTPAPEFARYLVRNWLYWPTRLWPSMWSLEAKISSVHPSEFVRFV